MAGFVYNVLRRENEMGGVVDQQYQQNGMQ